MPPSYSDCPRCADKAAAPTAAEQPAPVAQEAAAAPAVPTPAAPARPARLPGWALALLFGLAFVVILGGGLFAYQKLQTRAEPPQQEPLAFQPPSLPSPEAVKAHPMTRHIEVTALRLTEDSKQKAFIQFAVVNHSPAEIGDLAANVNLKSITAKGDQQPVGTFSFKIPLLGPYESKDLKAPVDTKLRVYELPDWQFLRADFQITSP